MRWGCVCGGGEVCVCEEECVCEGGSGGGVCACVTRVSLWLTFVQKKAFLVAIVRVPALFCSASETIFHLGHHKQSAESHALF